MNIHPAVILLILITTGFATYADSPPPARLVSDGSMLTVNGESQIPAGLFGVHAYNINDQTVEQYGFGSFRQIHFGPGSGSVALDREGQRRSAHRQIDVVIDCMGDRYHPPTVLQNKEFKATFERLGREYAERVKQAEHPAYVEFWNEPYLNWAERSRGTGRNAYHPKWYKVDEAREGGPVTIKGWDQPLDHLVWRRLWAKGADGRMGWGVAIPEGAKPGDTFISRNTWYWTNREEQEFTVVEEWHPVDKDAAGWWSGPQFYKFYIWMFEPFARAVREHNPDVTILAGWDLAFNQGDWAAWRQLYQPLLDDFPELIDGLTEHHYGSDTRWTHAWYEAAVAYSMAKNQRWIKGYNTETGGSLDPAVYGDLAKDQDQKSSDLAAATYLLRDITELMAFSPAKSGSRTAHHPKKGGELLALAWLKHFRGSLMAIDSDDHDVWPVMARRSDGSVAVLIFNNHPQDRAVTLDLTAPGGGRFITARQTTLGLSDGTTAILETDLIPSKATRQSISLAMPGRTAHLIELGTEAVNPDQLTTSIRRQHFASEKILHDVEPGQSVKLTIPIADPPASPTRARLRLVLEKITPGSLTLTLNGKHVDFPARNFTTDLPLDPAQVEAKNTLVFSCPADQKGYRVIAASIILDDQP